MHLHQYHFATLNRVPRALVRAAIMFKNLLGRAASAASNAVQALDDMLSLPNGENSLEEFKYYWETVQQEHAELVEMQALAHANETENSADGEDGDVARQPSKPDGMGGADGAESSPTQRRRKSTELLRESNIRENLEQLVTILRDEDAEYAESRSSSPKAKGSEIFRQRPCIEYMLDNHIMEILCAMGLADQPRGMMGLVLQVVKLLLQHVTHPLIPHVSVHRPINHLIHVCMEARTIMHKNTPGHKASYRMQSSLISLLAEIWRKIAADPWLIRFFFFRHSDSTVDAHSSSSSTTDLSSEDMTKSPEAPKSLSSSQTTEIEPGSKRRPKMLIFTALLPFMQLHKRRTGAKARGAILSALSLREAPLLDFIAHQTLFCRRLAEGLGASYISLPSTLETRGGKQEDDRDKFHSEFVDRLQFCNSVMMASLTDASGTVLAEHLCRNLHRWFLKPCLLPALASVNESAQIAAMTYTTLMIEVLHETTPLSALLTLLSRFLLGIGDGGGKLIAPDHDGDNPRKAIATKSHELRSILIHRINSQVAAVSHSAMELFNILLELSGPEVLTNLVLLDRNVGLSATLHQKDQHERENADALAERDGIESKEISPVTPQRVTPQTLYTTPEAATMSPSAVFLSRFQDSPKPAPGSSSRPFIFEEYLTDAHTQSVARMAAYWSAPDTVSSPASAAKDSEALSSSSPRSSSAGKQQSKEEDKEGPTPSNSVALGNPEDLSFLDAIYDKLEGMLDETMDENLVLTSILSKLLQCPNQLVHDCLMRDVGKAEATIEDGKEVQDKANPSGTTVRSLVSVLRDVWQEAQERSADMDGFQEAVNAHRIRLGTTSVEESSNAVKEIQTTGVVDRISSGIAADRSPSQFCEGFIVLEEFLKELSAIIQARVELGCVKVPGMW